MKKHLHNTLNLNRLDEEIMKDNSRIFNENNLGHILKNNIKFK